MLIRLIPHSSAPTVLFTLSFPNLPEDLSIPVSYVHQLNRLSADDLELPGPAGLHALDKAAGLVNIMEEVTFNMNTLRVNCAFLDGSKEEWPLMDTACMYALETVLFDVNEGAVEAERERRILEAASRPPSPPVVTAPKFTKHKKQRSILMTLVSLVSPLSSSPPTLPPTLTLPSPRVPTLPPLPPSVTGLSSKILRRRSRSTLCDAFARFVLPELRSRLHLSGRGYPFWIAQSMLQRAESGMNELLRERAHRGIPAFAREEFGLASAEDDIASVQLAELAISSLTTSPTDTLFDVPDEDVDQRSLAPTLATDTSDPEDETSIKTPPDSISRNTSFRSPGPCSNDLGLSSADYTTYKTLSLMRDRLRALLLGMEFVHREIKAEQHQSAQVLEIKSRRRAWGNRSLLLFGDNRSDTQSARRCLRGALVRDCGLGVPVRRSPLGLSPPVTARDLEVSAVAAELALLAMQSPRPRSRCLSIASGLSISSGPQDLSALFSDDDFISQEEGTFLEHADVEDYDLESGLGAPFVAFPTPQDPPHAARYPPELSSASLLCQPLPPMTSVTKVQSHRPKQRPRKASVISGTINAMDMHASEEKLVAARLDDNEWLPGIVSMDSRY